MVHAHGQGVVPEAAWCDKNEPARWSNGFHPFLRLLKPVLGGGAETLSARRAFSLKESGEPTCEIGTRGG
jgi:hypothetical protein